MKLPVTCKFDIVIAGGGAAGLAAAVKACLLAKSPEAPSALRIALIEKKEVPGKKLVKIAAPDWDAAEGRPVPPESIMLLIYE